MSLTIYSCTAIPGKKNHFKDLWLFTANYVDSNLCHVYTCWFDNQVPNKNLD